MTNKLSPYFIELARDACLKAFWRKATLRTFLLQHGISESTLATWHSDLTKRDFLQILFEKLILTNDNRGHLVILNMAKSLSAMKSFPDLVGFEDSSVKISEAHMSVNRLKIKVEEIEKHLDDKKAITERKKVATKKMEEKLSAIQTLESLSSDLNRLATTIGTQEAGIEFEKWFYKLASYHEITARPSYHHDGRQFDGSLTLDGTTFLLETKFTTHKTDGQEIDIFYSKILKKADNTMGIFLSMAGFTSIAIKDASRDRTPILLLDSTHIYNLILPGIMTLPDVIRRIKRHASQTGQSLLHVADFSS